MCVILSMHASIAAQQHRAHWPTLNRQPGRKLIRMLIPALCAWTEQAPYSNEPDHVLPPLACGFLRAIVAGPELELLSALVHSQKLAEVYMPELEEVKTRLNLSRPFEDLPTKNHYSHAQRDAGSVQVVHPTARVWVAECVRSENQHDNGSVRTIWHEHAADYNSRVQMSLSALPGVDWARYSSVTPGTAKGGWDLLSDDGLPYPTQQQNGNAPSAPSLSLLTDSSGFGGRYIAAASAEALSRHALLPAPEQRRQSTSHQVLQLAQRPLYPKFDATPARPIDYGFTRSNGAPSAAADQRLPDGQVRPLLSTLVSGPAVIAGLAGQVSMHIRILLSVAQLKVSLLPQHWSTWWAN